MTLHHPAFAPEPRPVTAESLFTELFTSLFDLRKDLAQALGGSIRFELDNTRYRVDFGQLRIDRDASEAADLTVRLSDKDLEGWLKGTVDIPSRVRAGAVTLSGNIEMLAKLGLLFSK